MEGVDTPQHFEPTGHGLSWKKVQYKIFIG